MRDEFCGVFVVGFDMVILARECDCRNVLHDTFNGGSDCSTVEHVAACIGAAVDAGEDEIRLYCRKCIEG